MPSTVHSFAWRFGGPLAGLPPALAWTLLALASLLGAAWIVVSYRRTLVALPPGSRRLLVALRLLLWTGVLLALAGPSRVERSFPPRLTRPLAVLVDRSASMTTPDNRRQRRLDDALRRCRALAPAALAAHGEPRVFAFADTSAPSGLAAPEADASLPAGQTRLLASLDHLLAEAPPGGWGGIVALTDGLDTVVGNHGAAALAATTRAALAAGTPVYPVPGRNRHAGGDLFAFRELSLPARVPPRSRFRLEVALDTFQAEARTVPLYLKIGDKALPPEPLRLAAGRRALAWSVEIPAELPGILPLELRAGDGPGAPLLRAEVRVAPSTGTRILYYQGALDWGYRFLADILRRDPAFTLTPVFNLAPAGTPLAPPPVRGSLPDLPSTAAGYSAHDVLLLANVAPGQLSAAQQAALSAWVRTGGVLLFIAPDDDATGGFAGTELEKLLPVTFLGAGDGAASLSLDSHASRERTRRFSGGDDGSSYHATQEPPLASFAWEPAARVLFGDELARVSPRFGHYARVRQAKPGAEVLARHPEALSPAGERSILLAMQRYGRGWSAVLASDALWRWKLNQPSQERGAELFWQNLLAWLARESARGPRFQNVPLQAFPGEELTVDLADAPAGLRLAARREDDPTTAFPLLPSGEEAGLRRFRWTPPAAGRWVLEATVGEDPPLRHWLEIVDTPRGETSGLPADDSLLRTLAERTGGAVLDTIPPPAWQPSGASDSSPVSERVAPLWHHATVFFLLLGVYAAELILRRRHKLL